MGGRKQREKVRVGISTNRGEKQGTYVKDFLGLVFRVNGLALGRHIESALDALLTKHSEGFGGGFEGGSREGRE